MAYNNGKWPVFRPPRKREPPRASANFAKPLARCHGCAGRVRRPTSRPPCGRARACADWESPLAEVGGKRTNGDATPGQKKSRISVRIRPREKYGKNGRNCTDQTTITQRPSGRRIKLHKERGGIQPKARPACSLALAPFYSAIMAHIMIARSVWRRRRRAARSQTRGGRRRPSRRRRPRP